MVGDVKNVYDICIKSATKIIKSVNFNFEVPKIFATRSGRF